MPFESQPDNDAVNKLLCHDGPKYLCKVCGASFVRSNHGKFHNRLKHQVEVLNEIQAFDDAASRTAEEAQSVKHSPTGSTTSDDVASHKKRTARKTTNPRRLRSKTARQRWLSRCQTIPSNRKWTMPTETMIMAVKMANS